MRDVTVRLKSSYKNFQAGQIISVPLPEAVKLAQLDVANVEGIRRPSDTMSIPLTEKRDNATKCELR